MEYEINISPESKEKDMDLWGAAFLWLDRKRGVEYNLCYQNGICCSAIYKMKFSKLNDNFITDYDTYSHYEINFDDNNWEKKLVKEMKKVAIKFRRKEECT